MRAGARCQWQRGPALCRREKLHRVADGRARRRGWARPGPTATPLWQQGTPSSSHAQAYFPMIAMTVTPA